MADICDSCAFEDVCPSAHFNITEASKCAFYKAFGGINQTGRGGRRR